jgi:hypothetical protein
MFLEVDDDVEVACSGASFTRLASTGGTESRSFVNAGRNVQLDSGSLLGTPFAAASSARFVDGLSLPMALGTWLGDLEESS